MEQDKNEEVVETSTPGLDEEVIQKSEVSTEADEDEVLEGVEEVEQSKEELVEKDKNEEVTSAPTEDNT